MEPRASSDASLARLLPGAHCRLDVRVVDVVRLCVREDADVSWVVPPEARREALEDDVCFVEVSCVCIRTYGTSLLYSRVCTHTKTVLDLNDAPETLLYRQARSAVVGAERAVLIGPVRGLQWSKM